MNRKAIKRTRNAIIDSGTYDQTVWVHDCETPGCIAGHAICAHGWVPTATVDISTQTATPPDGGLPQYIDVAARDILGLDSEQADELFSANAEGDPVAVLNHLLETGEVDWSAK